MGNKTDEVTVREATMDIKTLISVIIIANDNTTEKTGDHVSNIREISDNILQNNCPSSSHLTRDLFVQRQAQFTEPIFSSLLSVD